MTQKTEKAIAKIIVGAGFVIFECVASILLGSVIALLLNILL